MNIYLAIGLCWLSLLIGLVLGCVFNCNRKNKEVTSEYIEEND